MHPSATQSAASLYGAFHDTATESDDTFTLEPITTSHGVFIPTYKRAATTEERVKGLALYPLADMSLMRIVIGKYYNIIDSYNYFVVNNKLHPETRNNIPDQIKNKITMAFLLKDAHSPVLSDEQISEDILNIMKNKKNGQEYIIDPKLDAQSNLYKMKCYHASFNREIAETTLSEKPIGSWLLRPSSWCPTEFIINSDESIAPTMHYFVLSVKFSESSNEKWCHHFLLEHEFGIGYKLNLITGMPIVVTTFPLVMIELVKCITDLIPENIILS